ncbi:MAG: GTPase [Thermoproteota archaeon]
MDRDVEARADIPWLRKHIEARRLVEATRIFKEARVYTADEIISIIGKRYWRVKRRRRGEKGRLELELKRLELVYNISVSKLKAAAGLPKLSELSSFHRMLIESFVGDKYEEALKHVKKAIRLISKLWKEYRLLLVSSSSPWEAARLRKEGSGRILSVVKRADKHLKILQKVRGEILKSHVISEGLPVVVVAGAPSVGKSTLVRSISTAKPEVAEYPFTTKTVIVGKAKYKDLYFYVVDVPGILERSLDSLNEIEKRAYAALMTLPDVILHLFDVSPSAIATIEDQLSLLTSIAGTALSRGSSKLLIALNKVDTVEDRGKLALVKQRIVEHLSSKGLNSVLCESKIYEISAIDGTGIRELLESIYACLSPSIRLDSTG